MQATARPRLKRYAIAHSTVLDLLDRVNWSGPDRAARAHAEILALMHRTGCSDVAAADRIVHVASSRI